MEQYTVTGNDRIALPRITSTGAIEDITFLHMGVKGMFDLAGDEQMPFLRPIIYIDGRKPQGKTKEEKLQFWIPRFVTEYPCGRLEQTILPPTTDRGFVLRLRYHNTGETTQTVMLGAEGKWAKLTREINETDTVDVAKHLSYGWRNAPVFYVKESVPLFAFSFLCDRETEQKVACNGLTAEYSLMCNDTLAAGETATLDIAFGLGYDGVAAVTSALELLRQTFDVLLTKTCAFLKDRSFLTGDGQTDERLNYNLFFCYYFAAGVTLDTEELVMVTSRSPRYYVSAAYWDRDGLLWAFPAILQVDRERARAMLDYVFTRQIKNVGEHSRYIDGTVLEPGFELDELCAPVLALCQYYEQTGDKALLSKRQIVEGVKHILTVLKSKKHDRITLYETFLYPSDDMREYPYLTYDNALVSRMLKLLSVCYRGIVADMFCEECCQIAEEIDRAIFQHCVVEENGKKVFAWCVDCNGGYKIYDEPPGSLVLLPYFGFCERDNEIYRNTLRRLYAKDYAYSFAGEKFSEIGCAHYPKPWVLSYCNSLLAKRGETNTIAQMLQMPMDHHIACESISEKSGEMTSGAAFATCAGLYAYALMTYYENTKNQATKEETE